MKKYCIALQFVCLHVDLRACLLFFVVDSFCLYVICMCVRLSVTNIASFLFIHGIEPFLGHQFSMTNTTKRCSSVFDLSHLTPKINLLPKICTKSPISRLVWQIDRRCLHILWGFRGWPIQLNHAKMLWGRPLLPWQRNLA